MNYQFQNILDNLEEGNTLELTEENFSNEILLNEYLQCAILGKINFFNCDFESIDFTGSTFVACKFNNCRVKNTTFRKSQFWNSTFESCQIEKCDLTRGGFYGGNFKNCNFLDVNLRASDFSDFEFIETKFNNSNLDLIGVRSVKLWQSNQCIEIEKSSNFKEFLNK